MTYSFKGHALITGMSSYQLLLRLLNEQCSVGQDAETQAPTVSIKPSKKVPSDPDASYDGHKGQGYQMPVSKTFCPEEEKTSLSLITAVIVKPAHQSDNVAYSGSGRPILQRFRRRVRLTGRKGVGAGRSPSSR
ncbi:MAG: hypothetical protein A2156_05035 [Deltaproteobacteria bacterium RBG_16_48_10]|nr:MAG: hypothetical protein A2156_05035 [Deltaproteobacteria bacterium RBG_16_48_10]